MADLVEGPLIDMDCCASGYGKAPITHIHGLTIAELGLFFYDQYLSNNDSKKFQIENAFAGNAVSYNKYDAGGYVYAIKRMEGYKRMYKWSDMMIQRGSDNNNHNVFIPWVPPSPNIPTTTTALAYPSTCFLEATTVAEGRGTNTPFELFGAPFIADPNELASYMNEYCSHLFCDGSEDVCVNCARATYFQPTFSKYNDTVVPGIQWVSPQIFNYELPLTGTFAKSKPFLTATTVLRSFIELADPPDAFQWDGSWFGHPGVELIDSYAGTRKYRQMLNNLSYSVEDIYDYFKPDAIQFSKTRERYLLYV